MSDFGIRRAMTRDILLRRIPPNPAEELRKQKKKSQRLILTNEMHRKIRTNWL